MAATLAGAATVTLLVGVFAYAQTAPQRSVRDGVFSALQVERGRESFLWQCMECHEIEEFTGVGAYLEKMEREDRTLWEVFEYIWSEMPEDKPAWLEPSEYADILAYVLSVYGLPTGDADMPIDEPTLDAIRVEAPSSTGS